MQATKKFPYTLTPEWENEFVACLFEVCCFGLQAAGLLLSVSYFKFQVSFF